MRLLGATVIGFLALAVSAQYEYDYSYGYDFYGYDNDFYGDDGYGGGSSYDGYADSWYSDSSYKEYPYDDKTDSASAGTGTSSSTAGAGAGTGADAGAGAGAGSTDFSGAGAGPGSAAAGGMGGYGSYYDEYGYYGDEDQNYYEYYGYYADDAYGYEDYYAEEYDFYEECFFDATGKPSLVNGTASCGIKVSGVDKQADKLKGGVDGVYALVSCYNGKPMYRRSDSPAGEDRVMWYSSTFGDWDVSKGSEPSEADILMYGGEMEHASTPLFVSSWHLGGDLRSGGVEDEYAPIKAKVACSDGTVFKPGTVTTNTVRSGPALTDAEIEAKYQRIYDRYRQEPSPTLNFTFVVLLVMTGLTIVLAIPYFLLKKKPGKSASSGSVSSSFAQMLQNSRKKQAGHAA